MYYCMNYLKMFSGLYEKAKVQNHYFHRQYSNTHQRLFYNKKNECPQLLFFTLLRQL